MSQMKEEMRAMQESLKQLLALVQRGATQGPPSANGHAEVINLEMDGAPTSAERYSLAVDDDATPTAGAFSTEEKEAMEAVKYHFQPPMPLALAELQMSQRSADHGFGADQRDDMELQTDLTTGKRLRAIEDRDSPYGRKAGAKQRINDDGT